MNLESEASSDEDSFYSRSFNTNMFSIGYNFK